jgi:hypothetical protein
VIIFLTWQHLTVRLIRHQPPKKNYLSVIDRWGLWEWYSFSGFSFAIRLSGASSNEAYSLPKRGHFY